MVYVVFYRNKIKKIIAAILTVALLLSTVTVGINITASAAETDTSTSAPLVTERDYISDVYTSLTEGNHVFEDVTVERLNYILGYNANNAANAATSGSGAYAGNYVIVFGGAENASTQAAIGSINKVAKQYGIGKIYHFDPKLDGDKLDISNIPDNFNTTGYYGAATPTSDSIKTAFRNLWSGTNGIKTRLKSTFDANYTSDDTYLFVYNKDHTTLIDGKSTSTPLISGVLSKATSFTAAEASAYESSIANAFNAAKDTATNTLVTKEYPLFDYFQTRTNGVIGSSAAYEKVRIPDSARDTFTIQPITLTELKNLLAHEGDYLIYFGGTWCPYTNPTNNLANTYALKHGIKKIYQFDARLGGTSSTSLHLATAFDASIWGALLEKFPNLAFADRSGDDYNYYKNATTYYPNNDTTQPARYTHRIGVPFFFEYNKDRVVNNSPAPVVNQATGWKPFQEEVTTYGGAPLASLRSWLNDPLFYTRTIGRVIDPDIDDWDESLQSSYDTAASIAYLAIEQFLANVETNRAAYDIWKDVPTGDGKEPFLPSESGGCGTDGPLDDTIQSPILGQNGNAGYDALHYDINLSYTQPDGDETTKFPGTIKAVTTIKAKALESLPIVSFDFRDLNISKIEVDADGDGNAYGYTDAAFIKNNNNRTDTHKIVITPGTVIPAGNEFTVKVTYSSSTTTGGFGGGATQNLTQGLITSKNSKGATGIGEPNGAPYWFPSNNNTTDRATYDIHLTSWNNLTGISVGNLVDKVQHGNGTVTTWHWKQDLETIPYLVFASFGDYYEFQQNVTLTDGTVIPSYSYVDKTLYNQDAATKAKVYRYAKELQNYIQWGESRFGKYPANTVGFVFEDLKDVGYSLETVGRPFFSGVPKESTFVHEFIHQWFGDAITIAGWEHLWLNEGFASYFSNVYFEDHSAGTAFEGETASDWYSDWFVNHEKPEHFWDLAPSNPKNVNNLFGDVVYGRAAYTLAALRVKLGDEDFFKAIKAWVDAKSGTSATTDEFVASVKLTTGTNLSDFFNTWLYSEGSPSEFPTPPLSSAANITQFSTSGAEATITGTDIAAKVPFGTNVKALTPNITVSDGADYSPKGAQDFTTPVDYTVTAADGSKKVYQVTVTVAIADAVQKSAEKNITSFKINGVAGKISGTNITVTLPYGINIKSLKPEFSVSGKASSAPANGVVQNFTNPVNYTVTAEDGSKKVYKVTVSVEKAKNGWIKNYYYKNGKLLKNAWVSNKYRTDANGKKITNKVVKIGEKYFKFNKSGLKQKKKVLLTYKNKKYYVSEKGIVLKKGKTFKIGQKTYKANKKTGAVKKVVPKK